jgi:hypothetical protein
VTFDVKRLRYRYDDPSRYELTLVDRVFEERIRSRGLSQNIRVSDRVLPRMREAAREAASRLAVVDPITVFVYANAEPNALCYSDTDRGHILVFVSSTLVTSLQPQEWQCIVGHELGHHLLGHHRYPEGERPQLNLRALELKRASEISADRAGLIACADVDVALRVMLKVASGLDEKHLEIDVSDYMRQLAELRDTAGDEGILFSTHPPFPIRARAVLRFDSVLRELEAGADASELLRQTDESIQRDLDSASCGTGGNRFTEQARTAAFWAAASTLCVDGTFSSADQAVMTRRFGHDRVDALKRFLAGSSSKGDVLALLKEKAETTRRELDAAPLMAARRFDELMVGFAKYQPGSVEAVPTSVSA